MRQTTKAALAVAAAVTVTAALGVAAAGPALANYPPPTLRLLCSAAANNATLDGSVCVLPSGQTTAPNNYSATIAFRKTGVAATITLTVTAGHLPHGLTLPASAPSTSGGATLTGNPTQTGTSDFTIKATGGGLTATMNYQITITTQGPPDQLVCDPAVNGGFLENGVCVLPDGVIGLPYQGHLVTSHQAGGSLSVVSGALPPGLTLPATFTGSADIVIGTPTTQGVAGYSFTVQGTGDQGQPLYQAYSIIVDQNQPITIELPAMGSNIDPGFVGQAYITSFAVIGGAAPYTWSLASGQFPPGLSLSTLSATPRDANDELAGTPTALGTYTFTMRVTDYTGDTTTQQFTITVYPPLQVPSTTLPAGKVGAQYSADFTATGGLPPYTWFVVNNINELPPGLTLASSGSDTQNVLTGKPTQAGTFSFPMQVQDSDDNTVNATITVTINP